MNTTSTRHNNPLPLLFGDSLGALKNATYRSGVEPLVFLLNAQARDLNASADTLAALWAAEFDKPVDHAMIEVVLMMRTRLLKNWFLRKRAKHALRKTGFLPWFLPKTAGEEVQ